MWRGRSSKCIQDRDVEMSPGMSTIKLHHRTCKACYILKTRPHPRKSQFPVNNMHSRTPMPSTSDIPETELRRLSWLWAYCYDNKVRGYKLSISTSTNDAYARTGKSCKPSVQTTSRCSTGSLTPNLATRPCLPKNLSLPCLHKRL
jgi:hypothetical protein